MPKRGKTRGVSSALATTGAASKAETNRASGRRGMVSLGVGSEVDVRAEGQHVRVEWTRRVFVHGAVVEAARVDELDAIGARPVGAERDTGRDAVHAVATELKIAIFAEDAQRHAEPGQHLVFDLRAQREAARALERRITRAQGPVGGRGERQANIGRRAVEGSRVPEVLR